MNEKENDFILFTTILKLIKFPWKLWESLLLNVNDLSWNPIVDALSSFFRCLNNDARDGALHVLINQSTGIDAQAAIDILKIEST